MAPKKLTGLPKSGSPVTFWNWFPKFPVLKTLKASKKRPSFLFSPHLKNFETRTFNCENLSPRSLLIGNYVLIIDSRINRLAVIGYAITVDVANAVRKNAVGPCRCHLEDRRDLEIPRQIEDTRDHEAMALVFASWPKVNRVKLIEQVLRLQSRSPAIAPNHACDFASV